jgi:multicomponent Na+:H+ antiporter subunit A
MQLPALTFAIFLAAALVPLWHRVVGRGTALFAAAAPFAAFLWLLGEIPAVAAHRFVACRIPWLPDLGIWFSMRLDGLALLFALLVTGIGVLVLVYAGGYMGRSGGLVRLLAYLLFFMGSMVGLVLSDNLLVLFVFWELTGVSSYLLIGFKHEDAGSRRNALQALLVTGLGGLALLAGIVLLGVAAGTLETSRLAAEDLLASPLTLPAMMCILAGAFAKSAIFPLHFWLPNAMCAPTPVSAYLHSATMVKAGIFLIARLNPAFAASASWSSLLFGFGAATMLLGAILGLLQTDLKRILAYTTLSVLGMLTMLIGVETELALQSAMFFLFGHALYKAALFLCAGNIDHACGTRNVRRLRGLRFALPVTAASAALAAYSAGGFPPFFGFLGKEYAYKSGVALNEVAVPVLAVAFVMNLILLSLSFQAGIHPFFGKREDARLDGLPHGLPASMWLPPAVLGIAGLLIGLFPGALALPLVQAAVSSVEGQPVALQVALWHGLNLPVLLSGLTVGCGLVLYRMRHAIWEGLARWSGTFSFGFDALYDKAYAGVLALAGWQTAALQNGKLHRYLFTVAGFTASLLLWKLWALRGVTITLPDAPVQPLILGVLVMMAVSAVFAMTSTSRLAALASLGLTGYGIAFLFANYGAPDLAITQVLVETLTIVFFMTALRHLPRIREMSPARTRLMDAGLAGVAGALVSLLVLLSMHLELAPTISSRLAEWSYTQAHGRNVVNVILVDFRALDTLGEIVVLGIAALGVVILLGAARRRDKTRRAANPLP